MNNDLYPLEFTPQYFEKPWGGEQIKNLEALVNCSISSCGEVWLLSGIEEKESVVENGFLAGNNLSELLEVYMEDLVGEKVFVRYGESFPLLIKILDTTDWLSVQVHPNDQLAERIHGVPFGKTEMWHIISANENARLLNGFKAPVSAQKIQKALTESGLIALINDVPVQSGETYFTPAGRIHAIGPGIMLAEIQQSSDVTYRIYDWDRTDRNGLARELHIEHGLQALDFDDTGHGKMLPVASGTFTETLVDCDEFVTNAISLPARQFLQRDFMALDSFVIWLCTKGSARYSYAGGNGILRAGSCLLIPATLDEIRIDTESGVHILETYIKL